MSEYDRIDISEGIDVKECNEASGKCSLCKLSDIFCDRCHDISTKATSMQNLAITYRVNFVFMSKNDAFNLIKNSNIIDKKGVL